MSEFTHQYTCGQCSSVLDCSYKNLVGIMFTDKHKNSGIPKKLTQDYSEIH